MRIRKKKRKEKALDYEKQEPLFLKNSLVNEAWKQNEKPNRSDKI